MVFVISVVSVMSANPALNPRVFGQKLRCSFTGGNFRKGWQFLLVSQWEGFGLGFRGGCGGLVATSTG